MFTFLFKRSLACLVGILAITMGLLLTQTASAQVRAGDCTYRCTNDAPTGNPPVVTGQASCSTSCPSTCASACAGRGGCFASECRFTDGQNPLTQTFGTFTRDRNRGNNSTYQCGYQYVVVNGGSLGALSSVLSANPGKTVSDMRCYTRSFDGSKCVRSAAGATGNNVICAGANSFCCTEDAPAPTTAGNCVQAAQQNTRLTTAEQTANSQIISAHASELNSFACRFVCPVAGQPAPQPTGNCLKGGCPGSESIQCCLPAAGGVIANNSNQNYCSSGQAAGGSTVSSSFTLRLPSCISTGNCQLSDILATGVNFANFLFGLAGAVFFVLIVYAGFQYVFFASDAKTAQSAKGMLTNAVIGLVAMMAASLMIRFFTTSVKGDTCSETKGADYACVETAGLDPSEQAAIRKATERGCVVGLCGQSASRTNLCCPLGYETRSDSGN